jgi:hypothetical protein
MHVLLVQVDKNYNKFKKEYNVEIKFQANNQPDKVHVICLVRSRKN